MALTGDGIEILAQDQSTGILYQGYDRDFHLCIFEEPGVQGRNERYEFRCDTSLECCGRVCCVPEAAGIPLCGYRTIRQADDDGARRGFGFVQPRRSSFHEEELFEESFKEEIEYGDGSSLGSELEDVEVERVERMERGSHSRSNLDQKFVPSPLQETLLEKPHAHRIVEHDDALSRGSLAPEPVDVTSPEPLRAQHAVYRPFVPDPLDETDFPPADRTRTSTHDLSELLTPRRPTISTLEVPEQQQAQLMVTRPAVDNVPSY
ncbi:Protein C44C10.9, isoform a [Aphelenchoides fujianensis]|nr:Protein C44C10.9, isoform a [Aphelenchoides fujianensis]